MLSLCMFTCIDAASDSTQLCGIEVLLCGQGEGIHAHLTKHF